MNKKFDYKNISNKLLITKKMINNVNNKNINKKLLKK